MKNIHKSLVIFLLICLALTACSNQNDLASQQTAVAGTVAALQTEMALLPSETPAPSSELTQVAFPTFTSLPPIATAQPSIAPTDTSSPQFGISSWKNVNVSEGTQFKSRQAFTKTWTLTNGGTEPWDKDFLIVFVSGDFMGVSSVPLGVTVYPGQSVQISLNLTAPISEGSHQANFMLQTDYGENFGAGANFDRPFSVQITVKGEFYVSEAVVLSSVPSPAPACPVTIQLTAKITVNSSGSVTYHFVTSQGNSEAYTMTFSEAGTKTSSPINFTVTSPSDLTVNLYIDDPNHQNFSAVTLKAPCTP